MGLPTLETERLILRPWSLDDIDALHQIWTDPQVRRNGVGLWCVLPKPASALAGFCGFRYIDDASEIELLYGLLPDYWGQGLATEAARAALASYGFDAALFTRGYVRTDVPNRASVRAIERVTSEK